MHITVNRKDLQFKPATSRGFASFMYTNSERSKRIIKGVLNMPEEDMKTSLGQVLRGFSKRHRNISKRFENHFNKLSNLFKELESDTKSININQKVLIGSYFTMKYSIESAALFTTLQ